MAGVMVTQKRAKVLGWEGERWVAYFWHTGWDHFSLGFHVCLGAPNLELHLPFGFLKLGRKGKPTKVEIAIDVTDFLAAAKDLPPPAEPTLT